MPLQKWDYNVAISVNYLWGTNACKYHADFSMARYTELSDFQFYSYS